MLNSNELERYDRQIIMRGFGEEGQEKLRQAKAFIARNSPVMIYNDVTVMSVKNRSIRISATLL